MRIVHVSAYFAPAFCYGGPPRSILGFCKGLMRIGVDVEVLTTTANGGGDLPPSGVAPDMYEGVPVRYIPRAFPRRLFHAPRMRQALARAYSDCDLLHIHGLWNMTVWSACCSARNSSMPYVISPRGMLDRPSLAHHRAPKRIAYGIEWRHLREAQFVHATSESERHSLLAAGFGSRVVMLPNGVELRRRASRGAFRRIHDLRTDTPLVLFLGRIHPVKRLDLLAEAFRRIRSVHPDAVLVIAGPDEAGHRQRVAPLFAGLGRSVVWAGEVADEVKDSLLVDADVLAACSDSESFGMSVVEAMAAGVPVVVTRTCPWSAVEAARAGFWVEQTPEAIAAGLLSVLADRHASRAMGERGAALVGIQYSWDVIARKMKEHYAAALDGTRPKK